jgi:hypothetical protein
MAASFGTRNGTTAGATRRIALTAQNVARQPKGGVATLGAAVEAGLGVAALSRRIASAGWIDAGARFGLPALPTREMILHSRTSGGAAACLRLLAGALRRAR